MPSSDDDASGENDVKLAASDVVARLHPDVLRAMRLPSRAHRV
jgi:hypothetical protein